MKGNTIITTIFFGGAIIASSSNIMAQTIGVEYTTEWQTDFDGGYDWLNLLKTSAEMPINSNLKFESATISTAKTGDYTLIDDLLTYSNIEAGNIPLTLARLGIGWTHRGSELFIGINNVNEDYFTSELTSFFTNSSCGISPTLSCNYDIANYPLASWCIHYRQTFDCLSLQTSLYPGQGYSRLMGHDNLFELNIRRDGIFSISSIDYKRNGIYCILGVALHYGVCIGDEEGEQIETPNASPEKTFSAAPWLLSEIDLPYDLGLLVHGSFSTVASGCKSYVGIGLIYNGKAIQPGISWNHASFTSEREHDIELSARLPILSDKAHIQPALHLVGRDGSAPKCVGMFRLTIEL